MTVDELVIDRQFAAVNSATHKRVDEDLLVSVKDEGFRDPIWYWVDGDRPLVVDGHRRLAVWKSLPADTNVNPPRLEAKCFKSRDHAILWMHEVSIQRRNLSAREYAIHRGRAIKLRAKLLESEAGGEVSGQTVQKPPSPRKRTKATGGRPKSHTRAAVASVAAEAGVSTKTAERDLAYVEAIDAIGLVNAKAKADIASGSLNLARATVVEIGALGRTEIGKALGNVRAGREWNDGIGKVQKPLEIPHERDALKDATALLDKLEAMIDDIPEGHRFPVAARMRKLAYQLDPLTRNGQFVKPTVADVRVYCEERNNGIDAEEFVDFYESKGWVVGKVKMKDWRAAVRTWEKERKKRNGESTKGINDAAFDEVFGPR